MKGPKTLQEMDKNVDDVLYTIDEVIKKRRVEPDRRGQWFSNSQLDNLRQLLELKGYKTARFFYAGKIEKVGKSFERARNEALVEIIDVLGESHLDVISCSYILGKLNSIVTEFRKKGVKNVQTN